jgi:hypothetical protein
MKAYVQFLELDLKGSTVEALGSDGVFILDGRKSLDTMTTDAHKRFRQMNKHLHNYVGWRIMKGERFDASYSAREWLNPHGWEGVLVDYRYSDTYPIEERTLITTCQMMPAKLVGSIACYKCLYFKAYGQKHNVRCCHPKRRIEE